MTQTLRRLHAFHTERAPWRIYLTYAVLWTLALEGMLVALSPTAGPWRLGPHLVAEILSVWLALIFVRLVDEQKDLEYDRQFNPGRPLPRGAITVGELRWAMLAIAVVEIGINLPRSPLLAGWLLLDLAYICFLVVLERWSRPVREGIFLNLAVSYPVQALLSVHIFFSFQESQSAAAHWSALVLVVLFACVFLHFEFARKTSLTRVEGAELYSNVVGTRGSLALTVGMALAAALLTLWLLRPWEATGLAALAAWLPFSALGFVWSGGEQFHATRPATWPPAQGKGFIAWYYLGLTVAAATAAPVTL